MTSTTPQSSPGHQPLEASVRSILVAGALLAALVIAVAVGMDRMLEKLGYRPLRVAPPETRPEYAGSQSITPDVSPFQRAQRQRLEQRETRWLKTYAWVEPRHEHARISLDRALELTEQVGLHPFESQWRDSGAGGPSRRTPKASANAPGRQSSPATTPAAEQPGQPSPAHGPSASAPSDQPAASAPSNAAEPPRAEEATADAPQQPEAADESNADPAKADRSPEQEVEVSSPGAGASAAYDSAAPPSAPHNQQESAARFDDPSAGKEDPS